MQMWMEDVNFEEDVYQHEMGRRKRAGWSALLMNVDNAFGQVISYVGTYVKGSLYLQYTYQCTKNFNYFGWVRTDAATRVESWPRVCVRASLGRVVGKVESWPRGWVRTDAACVRACEGMARAR
jgi:hypothetical protein